MTDPRHPVTSNLEVAKDGLENAARFLADETNPENVAVCLVEAQAVVRLARRVEDEIEKHYLSLCTTNTDRRREVPGVGLVEVKKATKYRAWQNAELMKVVVALALDERRLDEATGEYERESDAVARVIAECARPDWRLTPLRARHIDVSEYCEVVEDGYSVRIHAPAEVVSLPGSSDTEESAA